MSELDGMAKLTEQVSKQIWPHTMFLLEWEMDGQKWCMEVYAESWDDARKRLTAIRSTGKIIGEVF